MSQMIDFTVPSTVPGRTLHAFRCVPEGEVKAVLQLSHGMVEFIDRYKPLAEYLAGRGILVTGHDHLGHGGSIRTRADYGYFAQPDGNRAVLDDLHAVTALTKQLYPGVPYFLLGHSMGSFYARQYLCEWGGELDGAIIMGTGWQPKAVIAGGMAVNGVSALHSDILRNDVFKYQCAMEPEKFKNVTNGIDHRRWLAQIDPRLDELVRALAGGDEYLLHPEALKKLEAYAHDTAVLDRLGRDVILVPDGEDHFTVWTDVIVSPQFFAWLCGFQTAAKVIGPDDVVKQMAEHVKSIAEQYE